MLAPCAGTSAATTTATANKTLRKAPIMPRGHHALAAGTWRPRSRAAAARSDSLLQPLHMQSQPLLAMALQPLGRENLLNLLKRLLKQRIDQNVIVLIPVRNLIERARHAAVDDLFAIFRPRPQTPL